MSPPHSTVAHDCRRGKRRKERRRPSSGWLPNGDGLFGSFAQRRKRAGISMRRRRVSGCTVAGTAALESWVNFIRCLCPKLISNQNRVELCGICSKRALCCREQRSSFDVNMIPPRMVNGILNNSPVTVSSQVKCRS